MTNDQSNQKGLPRQSKKKRFSLRHAKSACYGKIPHKSMLAAQYILDRMSGKRSHLLEIYKCQFCKTFHIGHNRLLDTNNKVKTSA
jgi:hypothetical protein